MTLCHIETGEILKHDGLKELTAIVNLVEANMHVVMYWHEIEHANCFT